MPTSKSSIDHRDVYYRLGKSAGYRARSAYKLLHLDEEFDLFTGVQTAVDLCAAPGSWSQVLGQKLHPSKDGKRVVSLDLQPMAPLPNITTLQTDITLPSTIPLVLDALGGRKADLVVCDGAPDVTGVHDLDAYLHSQLLLAAITLSLTLLAPHATLIFKIFLSPLDPQAALLASQLRCFFPGPGVSSSPSDGFEEFDIPEVEKIVGESGPASEGTALDIGKDGYDALGRRGGVWVRKPRSSRKGSGEAFIVCRNFDPSRVPLPSTFTESSLAELRTQTAGTLTLDSLASLGVGESKTSKEWETIKGYVGGGDLNPIVAFPTPAKPRPSAPASTSTPPISLQLPDPPAGHEHLSTSPKALFAQPTPLDGPSEYFDPKSTGASHSPTSPTRRKSTDHTFLSPERLHIDTHRAASSAKKTARLAGHPDLGEGSSRQSSLDSLTPNPSPISLIDPTRPWAQSSHLPPPTSQTHAQSASLGVPSSNRFRSTSNASASSFTSAHREDQVASTTPLVSPALSSSSRTNLFFAASQTDSLPVPPRALPNAAALGRGLPSGIQKPEDRSTSMPSRRPDQARVAAERTSAWAESSYGSSIDLTSPATSSQGHPGAPETRLNDFRLGFEDISTSRLRSLSNPASHASEESPSRLLKSSDTNEPLPTRARLSIQSHGRRESQQLEREHREAREGVEVKAGDVVQPEDEDRPRKRGWKLVRKLGEGAFSSVWSALSQSTVEDSTSQVAALKMMDRQLSLRDSRTRISFLREVEVLRHISHPSIVSYLDSFTTPSHHVLVLEELSGGELFDLMSDDENRRRMILPSPRPGREADGVASEGGSEWDKDGEGFVRRVFGELARAVGWLHEVGVVHRDIKLENILFTINPFALPPTSTSSIPLHLLPRPGPLVKLTDFGLSRFISLSAPLLQTRCGSESFAAPEIIMGKPYDGRETDAWAMGVVLYGLVVGELPFDREEETGSGYSSAPGLRAGTPASSRLITPGLLDARTRGRKRMMRIAKGEYSFPPETGSERVRELVGGLLVRDPKKRLRVSDIWDQGFMDGPGGVSRPPTSTSTSTPITSTTASPVLGARGGGDVSRRRVLDGFLVEEDGIEEVARVEL